MNLPHNPDPTTPQSGDRVPHGDGYLEVVRVAEHGPYRLVVLRRLDRDFRATGQAVDTMTVGTWADLVRRRGGA